MRSGGMIDWAKVLGGWGECDLTCCILALNLDREIENVKNGDRDFDL